MAILLFSSLPPPTNTPSSLGQAALKILRQVQAKKKKDNFRIEQFIGPGSKTSKLLYRALEFDDTLPSAKSFTLSTNANLSPDHLLTWENDLRNCEVQRKKCCLSSDNAPILYDTLAFRSSS